MRVPDAAQGVKALNWTRMRARARSSETLHARGGGAHGVVRWSPVRFPQLARPVVTFRGPLLAHPFTRWCAIAAIAFLAGAWIAILAIPNIGVEGTIIVHYTTTFGIDALGPWEDLLRLPFIGTVLLAVNCGLARLLAQQQRPADAQPGTASSPPGGTAPNDRVVPPGSLPHAPVVLMIASVLLEFAVLVGALLLLSANSNRS